MTTMPRKAQDKIHTVLRQAIDAFWVHVYYSTIMYEGIPDDRFQ
jgi:hypothetical protein